MLDSGEYEERLVRKATLNKHEAFRWIVLIIVCICVYSMIYCYDNPFALQTKLQDEYGLSSIQYNLLYSIYGWVNAISPLISGLLIDYVGINSSSLLFYTLVVCGQSLWVLGCMQSSYPLMVLGRGIFGAGTQPFHTSRKYYSFEYFEGKEYSFASGMTLFASRIASATQSYITTFIYDVFSDRYNRKNGIVFAISAGWLLVMISIILLIIFIIYRKMKFSKGRVDIKTISLPHILYRRWQRKKRKENVFKIEDKKKTCHNDKKQTSFKENSPLMVSGSDGEMNESKFNLDGLWKGAFDKRFTILSVALCAFYSSYLSFTNVGSSFLQSRFNYSYDKANELIPIIFFIAGFTIPLFGILCDRFGKRCQLLTLSAILLITAHCILGFAPSNSHIIIPIIGLISFGFGMSIGSSILWPIVGLICTKQYLATALGFIGCLDNACQGTSFLIVGALTKKTENSQQYQYVTYWVLSLAIIMCISCLLLAYYDNKRFGGGLNRMEAKFDKTISKIESITREPLNEGDESMDSDTDTDTDTDIHTDTNAHAAAPQQNDSLIQMQSFSFT